MRFIYNSNTYPLSHSLRAMAIAVVAVLTSLLPGSALALPASHYAENSALAQGRWARVRVESDGIQHLSAATLKSMGFSDPTKVNVYGFGGRVLPDIFSELDPDDLPLLPCVRTSAGISFFGFGPVRRSLESSSGVMTFSHEIQPYAEESWYFVSDVATDGSAAILAEASQGAAGSPTASTFRDFIAYEKDLTHPSNSGRNYLGEDFRSQTKQSFTFALPGAAGDGAARVSFGSKTPASSRITMSVKGDAGQSTGFTLPAVSSDFMTLRTGTLSLSGLTDELTLDIEFEGSSPTLARLNWIEVEYTRRLELHQGQLYFNTTDAGTVTMQVTGCSADTRIWDVTDPIRPTEVKFTLSGSQASFVTPGGYREYVAFNPGASGHALKAGQAVGNQNLHALPAPDMLIIAPAQYRQAALTLAEHHRVHDAMTVHVLAPEDIYCEFSSGTADVGAFRRILKMWRDRDMAEGIEPRTRYCLIMSRPTYDNKMIMPATKSLGAPRIPIWQSPTGFSHTTSYSTDDYIGMTEDTPDGRFSISEAKICVGVGRMPVTSATQAREMVAKIIDYVTNPTVGNWRNRIMLIADDQDAAAHFTQMESLHSRLTATERGRRFDIERLYLDNFDQTPGPTGITFPAAKEKMLRNYNDGVLVTGYIGHASTVGWTHENLFNWQDINSLANPNPFFLYAATCDFGRWDDDPTTGAEILWSKTSGGIIATICASRSVLISDNKRMSDGIGGAMFDIPLSDPGRRLGDILIDAKNYATSVTTRGDSNKLAFLLMGDPAMRLSVPEMTVDVESIGDIAMDPAPEDDVILGARTRTTLSGIVRNPDGSTAEDFDGSIDIVLYDAESVIETQGHGDPDYKRVYNDRTTVLYRGAAAVSKGRWNATLTLPTEIENNFTPARFTFYASDKGGREAHGDNTSFYVYGYDESAAEDLRGPDIELFAINREDFTDGAVVHSTPVALARFVDESGINLSDAGIGHRITLVLDDKKYLDDASSYYSPDPTDFRGGDLRYPLPELTAGEHSLRLVVWDNANNSSEAEVKFTVAAAKVPEILDLRTNAGPARESVDFSIATDRPMASMECRMEVFDIAGRRVWSYEAERSTDILANLSVHWDLNDAAGQRVPRGIYICRATISAADGTSATASRRIAVAAP